MVEWTDFYLVLFLDFFAGLFVPTSQPNDWAWSPRAAWAPLPPLDCCISLFWDTLTDYSSFLSFTTSFLQRVKPSCLTLLDQPAWMLQKGSGSLP